MKDGGDEVEMRAVGRTDEFEPREHMLRVRRMGEEVGKSIWIDGEEALSGGKVSEVGNEGMVREDCGGVWAEVGEIYKHIQLMRIMGDVKMWKEARTMSGGLRGRRYLGCRRGFDLVVTLSISVKQS